MRYLLHDLFLEALAKDPHHIAIREESGETFSYLELNTLANRFANFFKGHKKNSPYVGIFCSVHARSIAAVLGALKIGAAYVPLDTSSPVERLSYILETTKLDLIVADPHLLDLCAEFQNDLTLISSYEVPEDDTSEPPTLNQVCDDLAYILHSSGSTGIPKGIMLTHRNARTFVDWMAKEFAVTKEDVIMSRAPFKFDLSVFDIFNTFQAGATLLCYDWNLTWKEGEKHLSYVKLLEEGGATILYTTPSTFISLMNRGGLGQKPNALRQLMYAGEPFPVAQIRKLMTLLPNVRVANIYGPTETNIITYYWIDPIPPENAPPIPLGQEVDDTEIIVVAEGGDRICAPDELGELWCRGGTVTLGYLGNDEETEKRLVRSPFHPYPCTFWRTGDFGFRDKQGCLHYRGRRDHMVKVKGYRIELGEIERALSRYPSIDEFCVVPVPDPLYGNRLYCYYSMLSDCEERVPIETFLKTYLPDYMIPYRFFKEELLPKTSSGKIDRILLTEGACAV